MINYRLRWTPPNGERTESSVAYDLPTAEQRKELLERHGATDVEIFEVKPGE